MEELWKDVERTSGIYQVSNYGRLRKRKDEDYFEIIPHRDSYGYKYVTIKFDGDKKPKHIAIHRLVAIAFVSNPYNLPIVHHIDEDKDNNYATNLFWCTYAQNHSFAMSARNGIIDKHREIEQYTLNGEYIATYSSFSEAYRAVNKKTGTNTTSLISNCCQGKKGRKSAYGYIWRYGVNDPMYRNLEKTRLQNLFEAACNKSIEKVETALNEILGE